MTPQNRKMAELAMVISIPEFTKGEVKNGRLKNLYQKLTKTATMELERIPKASIVELVEIEDKVANFGKETGWEGKEKHIVTLASFCLGMLENSKSKFDSKIIEILNDIVDYFERAEKAPGPSFWAGSVAASKWNAIMEAK